MLLLIVCIVAVVVSIVYESRSRYGHDWPAAVVIFCGIIGLVVLAGLIFNPIEVRGDIARFNAVRSTVERARQNGESFEDAALQLEVAEQNKWLAGRQYFNSLFFLGDFIPDEVDELEPIR